MAKEIKTKVGEVTMEGVVQNLKTKQAVYAVLAEVVDRLNSMYDDACKEYRRVGVKDLQSKDWRTGELLWEDEEKTIPKMEDSWDYVTLTEEEMSDERKLKRVAIVTVLDKLNSIEF